MTSGGRGGVGMEGRVGRPGSMEGVGGGPIRHCSHCLARLPLMHRVKAGLIFTDTPPFQSPVGSADTETLPGVGWRRGVGGFLRRDLLPASIVAASESENNGRQMCVDGKRE